MNSSSLFFQRNFIRNFYGIFRKSESLQNLSIGTSIENDFRDYHAQPKQEDITVPHNLKRSGSVDSLNRYNNPVIKYYQERKRYFNSNIEDKVSEVAESRTLAGFDTSAVQNNIKIFGKIPFKETISQKDDDDDLSLNNAIVECKESCKVMEPPPNIRVADKQPVLQKKYYMEPYKRKMNGDGSCYNFDDDTRSLTLSIRDAMSKKRGPSTGPYRVSLMKNPDDDCKSLCLSISTSNGVEPMEKRIIRPVQSNSNKKIVDKIKKNRLKKVSLSESDLFTKLKKMSFKHHEGDQMTVSASYNNINSNINSLSTSKDVFVNKRYTTKQFLKQLPLPVVRPQKSALILAPSKKREKNKTYPWSCNVQKKTPFMGYGISPKNVTNITQHLISKKSGNAVGDLKRKKSSVNVAPITMGTKQHKNEDNKKEEKNKLLSPKNFINKIMSMYRNDKTT